MIPEGRGSDAEALIAQVIPGVDADEADALEGVGIGNGEGTVIRCLNERLSGKVKFLVQSLIVEVVEDYRADNALNGNF